MLDYTHANAPVRVSRGGRYMTGDSVIQGTLTTAILSDILAVTMLEIYIFWEEILTVKANGQQTLSPSESLGQFL